MNNNSRHQIVIGAGPVGTELTRQLIARGDTVIAVTRSGTPLPGAQAAKVDASDTAALTQVAANASTIFLCANPPYAKWPTAWPPIFKATITAAKNTGARLVIMGNLYAYGKADMPMTEHSPLTPAEAKGAVRAECWKRALEAHKRGDITAVEVRASDYIGPNAGAYAHVGDRLFHPLLRSKKASIVAELNQPHSWSYLPDIAATMIAASDVTDRAEWGRAWHVPSTVRTITEIVRDVNLEFGTTGRVTQMPRPILGLGAAFSPMVREVARMQFQFNAPFLVDSSETERHLGVTATDWKEVIRTTGAAA